MDISTILLVLGVLFDGYIIGLWLASGIALLFGAKRASARLYKAAFLPIDMIIAGVTWPKRQLDRQRFVKEFGFKPWEFAHYPSADDIIGDVLKGAADSLQLAFFHEETLQKVTRPVSKAEMAEAKSTVETFKREFWSLHNLARRVTGYHRYGSRCSYKDHLSDRYR